MKAWKLFIIILTVLLIPLLVYAAGHTWDLTSIDVTDKPGAYNALTMNSSGVLHAAYWENTGNDLMHAWYNSDGSAWVTEDVDSAGGIDMSITTNSTHNLHIAYCDSLNENLMHAYSNADGTWKLEIVLAAGSVGYNTAIAINSTDDILIMHYEGGGTNDLEFAEYNNAAGTWTFVEVDAADSVGSYAAIALNSTENAHVSYYDQTNGNLKHAWYFVNALGAAEWDVETVDNVVANVGMFTDIDVNSSDSVHISYWDFTNLNLKHAYSLPDGTWETEIVDGVADSVGSYSSLYINSTDSVHIIYNDATNKALKHAYSNVDGTWEVETITTTNEPTTSSLYIDSVDNLYAAYYASAAGIEDLKLATLDENNATISSPNPANGTACAAGNTSVTLSVDTNEWAECAYAVSGGAAWADMTPFTATNDTTHSETFTVTDGVDYDYYIRCRDLYDNENALDYQISFSVAAAEVEETTEQTNSNDAPASTPAQDLTVSSEQLSSGEVITLSRGRSAQISTTSTGAHTISLLSVQATSATFSIASEPQNVTITVNETKQVDLNNDAVMDIELTLKSTNTYKRTAEFSVKELAGEGPAVTVAEGGSKTLLYISLSIVALVGLILAIRWIRK